jgi:peroxiredoxin Q/BCP
MNMILQRAAKFMPGLLLMFGATSAKDNILPIDSTAPDFVLVSQAGDTVTLSSFKGKNHVVLIFYPGDQTPVCTRQLCAIRDDWSRFGEKGAVVFGVNDAGAASHQAFVDKNKFPFPLLVDAGSKVTAAYGCKGAIMAKRTVYVVDKQGRIIYAQRGKPANEEILKAIPADPVK